MFDPKVIALIGATASGKSALAVEIAHQTNAMIFSIDSLSIYKEVSIVAAKPTLQEQEGIIHRGIDELLITDYVSAATIASLYKQTLEQAQKLKKNLIVVGGSSFYLKSLITGLSTLPDFSQKTKEHVARALEDLPRAYETLLAIDPQSMQRIQPNDRYRIEKNYLIWQEIQCAPSLYFQNHPPVPVIENIPIYSIYHERAYLRERIALRTKLMLKQHLIDEVAFLEFKYSRQPSAMSSIGIKETLAYFDGMLTRSELERDIATHTAQLAKRQTTFNSTQFPDAQFETLKTIKSRALDYLRS